MTARQLLDRADILEVWVGLAGGPLRRNRGCAFWRGSESYSVSISSERNVFFDFGPGEGGGVLALVQMVRGCDRRDALVWLGNLYHADLDDCSLSIEQRRAWQRRRAESESWGAELLEFREALLLELRHRRNNVWQRILAAERFGRQFVAERGRDDLWNFCFECLAEEPGGQRLDEWVGRIEAMPPFELAALRERMSARRVIAA